MTHPFLFRYHVEAIAVKDKRVYFFLTLAVLILALYIVFTVVMDVGTDIEYAKMMEHSGDYLDKTFNITGQAFEVMTEGDDNYSMYVFTRKKELEYDDDVIYLTGYTKGNVKNEEIISCKGVFTGMADFTKGDGETIQIPQLQFKE